MISRAELFLEHHQQNLANLSQIQFLHGCNLNPSYVTPAETNHLLLMWLYVPEDVVAMSWISFRGIAAEHVRKTSWALFATSQCCLTRRRDDYLPFCTVPFSVHTGSFKALTEGNTQRIILMVVLCPCPFEDTVSCLLWWKHVFGR